MADLSQYRIIAVGPATALAGIEDDSISVIDGAQTVQVTGQALARQLILNRIHIPGISYTDKATMFAPTFTAVSAFGLHLQAQDSAGGDGLGVISAVGDGFYIPKTVRADKGGEASTTVDVMFSSALTKGTTSKSLTAATDLYKIGPSTLGGTAIANIESQELVFGLRLWNNAGQTGGLYATQYLIVRYEPMIRIVTTDLDLVTDYLTPTDVTTNACVLDFAKMSSAAGYQYTVAKARITGTIQGARPIKGTLLIEPFTTTAATAPITGAAY